MSELLPRFSVPDSFLELPGGRVATWRFGSGPDLIAVHGWPLHAATSSGGAARETERAHGESRRGV